MNAKEFIEKEKNAIFYGFDSSEKAFTLNEVLKWMEGYAMHKLASDGGLADVSDRSNAKTKYYIDDYGFKRDASNGHFME